jgi:hypothetical protein
MDELPDDLLARLNGDDRDSNLVPDKKKVELPTDLQKKLEEYNRNFEMLNNALGDDSLLDANTATELRVEKTREILVQALPTAVQTIMEIANYSLSDSIRLKAACYIVDKTMGKENVVAEDAATALLRKLTAGQEGG